MNDFRIGFSRKSTIRGPTPWNLNRQFYVNPTWHLGRLKVFKHCPMDIRLFCTFPFLTPPHFNFMDVDVDPLGPAMDFSHKRLYDFILKKTILGSRSHLSFYLLQLKILLSVVLASSLSMYNFLRFAPDNEWFIMTMNEVFELGGHLVQEDVAHNIMRLIGEGMTISSLLFFFRFCNHFLPVDICLS